MTQPESPQRPPLVRLRLASPRDVLRWSSGQVLCAKTLHPRSGKPEPGGLFCEKIFGPLVEWRCRCGRLDGQHRQKQRCSRCGTTVLQRRGRRRRMGHIVLAAPVAHSWFVKARPSPLGLLLELKSHEVEKVVHGEGFLVLDSQCPIRPGRVLDRARHQQAREKYPNLFTAQSGAGALLQALEKLDLEKLALELRQQIEQPGPRRKLALRRLRLVDSLRSSKVKPEWMILRLLPVVSPALRPVVRLESGRLASGELNYLYESVLRCNSQLQELIDSEAPESILREQRLALQLAVDALLDNRRCRRPLQGGRGKPLKSLSDMLQGKQGRFRGNLLGKRVDYSARSVIVVGPELQLHQCGLPRIIALRLFEPLLLGELKRLGWASSLRRGKQLLESLATPAILGELARLIVNEVVRQRHVEFAQDILARARKGEAVAAEVLADSRQTLADLDTPELKSRGRVLLEELPSAHLADPIRQRFLKRGRDAARRLVHDLLLARQGNLWHIVEQVITGHPVLLNRAPTLHRLGIQAFEPVLVEDNAIRLHPLVCKAFNADFDGDQMAVHLPLSEEAISEALSLMTPQRNLFNPASGQLIVTPSQDMVLGCYYLTVQMPATISLPTPMPPGMMPPVQFTPPVTDKGNGKDFASIDEVRLAWHLGKIGTHACIRLRLQCRNVMQEHDEREEVEKHEAGQLLPTTVGRALFNGLLPPDMPYYNMTLDSRRLTHILVDCRRRLGEAGTAQMLDRIKKAGFEAVTRSGLSFAADDVPVARDRPAVLREAQQQADTLRRAFEQGSVSESDYQDKLFELWSRAQKRASSSLPDDLRRDSRNQRAYLNPLHAMSDSKARGSVDQIRQLSCMRGLMASVSGRMIERPITFSLREGLPAADYFVSAYGVRKGLTDKGVRTADAGYLTRKIVDAVQQVVVTMADCGTTRGVVKRASRGALASRVQGRICPEPVYDEGGQRVVDANEMIHAGLARQLAEMEGAEVRVRSPITCQARLGVCQRCYGLDLATRRLVEIGTPVGVIAAQSIGEPGTQLTLRTFHGGGVAGRDIVDDLDRVSRLLEVVKVAQPALLAPVGGTVFFHAQDASHQSGRYSWDLEEGDRWHGLKVLVEQGDQVTAGRPLTDGEVDVRQLLHLAGREAAAEHLLGQIREIYRTHGLQIDDRHVEIVLGRMLAWVQVIAPGRTSLVPGQILERSAFRAVNAHIPAGHKRATARPWLLGVSQLATRAEGFLAAASFQYPVRILTEAALAGRVDHLIGLKENVMLGRAIPAGAYLALARMFLMQDRSADDREA